MTTHGTGRMLTSCASCRDSSKLPGGDGEGASRVSREGEYILMAMLTLRGEINTDCANCYDPSCEEFREIE